VECIEIPLLKCPKCNRVLKPSIKSKVEITNDLNGLIRLEGIEYLVCRYCKLSVKTSLLRKQKNPIKFLEQFAKAPEKTEISGEEKEKIRLREEHKENMEKYKHSPVPKKCPECRSEDIVADSYNYGWICLSCDHGFEWKSFRINFYGDVELEAENPDNAIERGYHYLKKGVLDIEAEVDCLWRR